MIHRDDESEKQGLTEAPDQQAPVAAAYENAAPDEDAAERMVTEDETPAIAEDATAPEDMLVDESPSPAAPTKDATAPGDAAADETPAATTSATDDAASTQTDSGATPAPAEESTADAHDEDDAPKAPEREPRALAKVARPGTPARRGDGPKKIARRQRGGAQAAGKTRGQAKGAPATGAAKGTTQRRAPGGSREQAAPAAEAPAKPSQTTPKPKVAGAGGPARKGSQTAGASKQAGVPKHATKVEPSKGRDLVERIKRSKVVDAIVRPTIATIAIACVAVIYVAGAIFFSSHFLPNTTVSGTDVSWARIEDVSEQRAAVASDYLLKVWDQGINFQLTQEDLSLKFDTDAFERDARSANHNLLWPLFALVGQHITGEGVSFDEDELESAVAAAVEGSNEVSATNSNATISYDEQTHTFTAVPQSEGEQLSVRDVTDQTREAVLRLDEKLQLTKAAIEKPAVVVEDPRFQEAMDAAASFPDLKIDLRLSNMVVETVTPDQVRSWLTVGEDYDIVANRDAIATWTRGDLSAELDSVGRLRTYTRPDGKKIQVYDGTYGWNIDGASLADLLAEAIDKRSDTPIEVPVTQRAAIYNPGGADWGKRYVDVDVTEQYLRMYDESGNTILETEVVTGNVEKNDGTVLGVYYLEGKESPKTLIGLDADGDGEPDYENDVEYWMPFYGGYGLHDALWRDNFDYDTYLTDGSHGCVNLPYYAAANLYDLIEVGDVVVVHE